MRSKINTVFVDSSVFFTAVNFPTGGSAKLFTLKNITLVTSLLVLAETERNVKQKLEEYHGERFLRLAKKLTILDQLPKPILVAKAEKIIAQKDAAILAEAKQAKTDFLVTLDKKHFLTTTAKAFLKPQQIVTPRILIEMSQ